MGSICVLLLEPEISYSFVLIPAPFPCVSSAIGPCQLCLLQIFVVCTIPTPPRKAISVSQPFPLLIQAMVSVLISLLLTVMKYEKRILKKKVFVLTYSPRMMEYSMVGKAQCQEAS